MKKILSVALMALFCLTISAQEETTETKMTDEIKASVNIGSTIGNQFNRDAYSTNMGADFSYFVNVTKDVMVGPVIGVKYILQDKSIGDMLKDRNGTYISFGAAARLYTDNDKFYIGGDAGYAVGLEEGGIYYRPMIGMVLSDWLGVYASFVEVDDENSFSSANFGLEFSF